MNFRKFARTFSSFNFPLKIIVKFQLEDALRMIRRETDTNQSRIKHEQQKAKKCYETQAADFSRKMSELESRNARQQGILNFVQIFDFH